MRYLGLMLLILFTSSLHAAESLLELKLLTFNVLYSGDHTPLVRTAHVIDVSDADIIALQESHTSTKTLADVLAMHHAVFAEGRAILSKHPIVEKLKHGVRIQLPHRQECYVFVVHFTAYPYQPYDLRDGKLKSVEEAVETARNTRRKEVDETLDEVRPLVHAGKNVFVMGDFNEPSHLDWTEAAKSRHFNRIVPWPTSLAMTGAGLIDAYRAIHPDPMANPGDTWTPWHDLPADEKHDRIDLVYFAGRQVRPVAAKVIGEAKDRADIVFPNYPSDHRAVLAAFEMPHGPMYGVNLIANGGAEYPQTAAAKADINWRIPHWESGRNTPVTTQFYNGFSADNDRGAGVLPKPVNAHRAYFYGGEPDKKLADSKGWVTDTISQTIDLTSIADDIDGGQIAFELRGHFGGWHDKNDHAALKAQFLDADGKPVSDVILIGNVTLARRAKDDQAAAGPSGLLADSARGTVPAGARAARLDLSFTWCGKGGKNDACADDLSLVLTKR